MTATSGPSIARSVATAIGGTARVLGSTTRALALDAVAAADTSVAAVRNIAAGRPWAAATLPVRVLILADEASRPLATADAIAPALARADHVLTAHAAIRVRIAGIDIVETPAPAAVLDPHSNRRLLLDDVLGHTAFVRRRLTRRAPLSVVGDPVTVVVVRTIAGRTTGCSLGMSADWVICQANLFAAGDERTYDETVLAHELGHALNLPHHRDPLNLMYPVSSPPGAVRGTALHRWQAAVLRANRHTVPPADPARPTGRACGVGR